MSDRSLLSMSALKQLYREFPSRFWVVVGVHFIDKVGGTLVFPFFALIGFGMQPRFAGAGVRSEGPALAMEAEHG